MSSLPTSSRSTSSSRASTSARRMAASCRPSPAARMSSSRCARAKAPRPRLNPYSLMSSPLDTSEYTISVRRDDAGRGGSLFMHRQRQTRRPHGHLLPGQSLFPRPQGEEAPDDRRRHRHHALHGADRAARLVRRQFRAALRLPHRLALHLWRRARGTLRPAASTSITTTAARRSRSSACFPRSRSARISISAAPRR